MDVRYSTDPQGFQKMTTEELRKAYLIDNLFAPDEVPMTYSDIDRSITGSAVPVKGMLKLLGTKKEMAAEYFCERREVGVINIGGEGAVTVDGKEFTMALKDVLYIGRGAKNVTFASESSEMGKILLCQLSCTQRISDYACRTCRSRACLSRKPKGCK